MTDARTTEPRPAWTLVVHGGAGIITPDAIGAAQEAAARAGLARALEQGGRLLAEGGSALDAVEAAVKVLEDEPAFNSGRGAVLTRDGTVELDAAIVDGRDRRAGAVAGVGGVRNPVSLARAVMEKSPHVLLVGKGAERFGVDQDVEQAESDWHVIPERRAQLDELLAGGGDGFDVNMKYGTVGAVARDRHGHLAAATSTGGVMGKRWGRVGDSPIPGAGTFADDRAGAVSATGSGEHFLRVGTAHEILARVRLAGERLGVAADHVIAEVGAIGGTGGVILVDRDGEPGWSFNSAGMYRGRAADKRDTLVAIFGDEG